MLQRKIHRFIRDKYKPENNYLGSVQYKYMSLKDKDKGVSVSLIFLIG